MPRFHITICGVLALVVLPPGQLAAQLPSSRHNGPVTVALVDALPAAQSQFSAAIVRTPGPTGRDVILLPKAGLSATTFDAATRVLLDSRVRHGDHPARYNGKPVHTMTIGVRGKAAPAAWQQQYGAMAQRIVDSLPNAPTRFIDGVGTVHALTIRPPAPMRRP
jgi:hypothetical protein